MVYGIPRSNSEKYAKVFVRNAAMQVKMLVLLYQLKLVQLGNNKIKSLLYNLFHPFLSFFTWLSVSKL